MIENGITQGIQDKFFGTDEAPALFDKDSPIKKLLYSILKSLEHFEDDPEWDKPPAVILASILEYLDEYVLAYEKMNDALVDYSYALAPTFDDAFELVYGFEGDGTPQDDKIAQQSWPLLPRDTMWGDRDHITLEYGALSSQAAGTENYESVLSYKAREIILTEVISHYVLWREEEGDKYFSQDESIPPGAEHAALIESVPREEIWGALPTQAFKDHISEKLNASGELLGEDGLEWDVPTIKLSQVSDHPHKGLPVKRLWQYKEEELPAWANIKTPEGCYQSLPCKSYVRPSHSQNVCTKDGGCWNQLSGEKLKEMWAISHLYPYWMVREARVPYYHYLYWDGIGWLGTDEYEVAKQGPNPGFIIQAMTVWNNIKNGILGGDALCDDNLSEITENYDWCLSKSQLETATHYFNQVSGKIMQILEDEFEVGKVIPGGPKPNPKFDEYDVRIVEAAAIGNAKTGNVKQIAQMVKDLIPYYYRQRKETDK
jgi:hypothetical protein